LLCLHIITDGWAEESMGFLRVVTHALALTAIDRIHDLSTILTNQKSVKLPTLRRINTSSPWLTSKFWSSKTVDGAVLFGRAERSGAKYALPKGLPKAGEKTLAIENEPHTVDAFSGVIESGYGKGVKTLLADETVVLKIKGKSVLTRMNYHVHDADVAGLHYDLVVEGLPEGTRQFELNIPRGEYKGRYAFVTTGKGMIVVPMKDRSIVLPKPDYKLKTEDWLRDVVAANPQDYVIERKVDGSLGNVVIEGERAYFRSHREGGEAYVDKLPGLEFLSNRSPFKVLRSLEPAPKLSGTILKGELLHADGVSRVSGILNSHPERAQAMQAKRGNVWFEAWDVVKIKGKDVSHLPAAERRVLLDEVIGDIRRFNQNWKTVDHYKGNDPVGFYHDVIGDDRGLPYSEGIVVKSASGVSGEPWFKIKNRDFEDFVVLDILPSKGIKYATSMAVLVVQDPITGGIGEVGSFAIPDAQRQWIWDHRTDLIGAVAKVSVMEKTASGAPRAGVFHGWHGDPRYGGMGTEMSLAMYSESLAGGDPAEAQRMLYRLKSSAGWKR
jgi:hypothetical protein